MTDAVIHAHWHANNDFSLSACGIKRERDDPLGVRGIWLSHDMAKVTCEACRKLVAAAGLAV